ncbi:MAG: LytTR family DNA-binding domain-containing protein [Veillonellales bacterium]
MRYKAVVVDDEQPICDEIEYLLNQSMDVDVCAKFSNSLAALAFILENPADIIFLDIQMPGLSGLEFGKKLNALPNPPLIVFITAYQEHALEAFGTPAVGYITKPVTEDKLSHVLHKIRNLTAKKISSPDPVSATRICVTAKGKIKPLDRKDIVLVYVIEKDVFVRTKDEEFECPLTMKELEDVLTEPLFLRVHRQYIVNLEQIGEIVPWFRGTYLLRMNDFKSQEVPVSRKRLKRFKQAVGLK